MQKKLLSTFVAGACLLSVNGVTNAADISDQLPDFSVSNFTFVDNLTTGTTTISLTVKNNGVAPYSAARSPLNFTMSTGTSLPAAEPLFEDERIAPFEDYGFRTLSWEMNSDLVSENLYVTLDPAGYVYESNEDNNDAVAVRLASTGIAPIEFQSTVTTDVTGGVATVGDSIGIQLATVVNTELDEVVSSLIAVTNVDGDVVYMSELTELSNGADAMSYEGYLLLDTSNLEAATYTIEFTVWGGASGKLDDVSTVVDLQSAVENNPPIAVDDSATTVMGESIEIDVQFNDVEPDGNGYNHYISSEPTHGDVEILRGVATYTPEYGFVGTDQFSYQMNDYSGASDWATVSVDVLPPEAGCTWVRDFEVVTSTERTDIDGWSDYQLPEDGRALYASEVDGNTNPDLFEDQPFVSFPSCSLHFKPKAGVTGTATVVYKVQDTATDGEEYTSETRTFEITLAPETTLPEFVSTPVTLTQINSEYTYNVELSDDTATLTALEIPDFLTLEDGVLSGTPDDTNTYVGMYYVTLVVDNGVQSASQEFLLTVEPELSSSGAGGSGVLSDDSTSGEQASAGPTDTSASSSAVASAADDVKTGGGGGFNPLWLLLGLPLLRRLR